MKHRHELDSIDFTILKVLQERARTKRSELAEETGLSVPAISDRLKHLEDSGVVKNYCAVVNHKKLGFDVTAFIAVTVDSSTHYENFLTKVSDTGEIIECHAITGEGTHLLKVRTKNTAALERLLSLIQSWGGVVKTTTRVVLSSPKETTRIPVEVKNE